MNWGLGLQLEVDLGCRLFGFLLFFVCVLNLRCLLSLVGFVGWQSPWWANTIFCRVLQIRWIVRLGKISILGLCASFCFNETF